MFSLASGLYENYFAYPLLNVLLVGAEGAGKTTLLERLKVTEFSKKQADVRSLASVGVTTTSKSPHGRRLSCPAPSRYQNSVVHDDDDGNGPNETVGATAARNPQFQRPSSFSDHELSKRKDWLNEKQQSSLEDVDFLHAAQGLHQEGSIPEEGEEEKEGTEETGTATNGKGAQTSDGGSAPTKQYNLKQGQKMFPLDKIRPTSGQNLAKLNNICGAKCHIFDISGKFHDLWERYYQDCDAVIFCWRLGWNFDHQRDLLESVRKSIPDDVPFLIFGHVIHNGDCPDPNDLPTYSTEQFLPNYHSNVMQVYCGSAKNGMGVREAIEWLIPLAKRFAKLRQQNRL